MPLGAVGGERGWWEGVFDGGWWFVMGEWTPGGPLLRV